MVLNRKPTGTAVSLPAGIGIGVGITVLITVIGAAVLAWLINGGAVPELGFGYGAMAVLLLSSALGSWIAAALVKHQRLVVCLVTGGIYFLLLIGLTAFCFGGQYQGLLPTALLIVGGSTAAALLGNMGQGNRTSGRHKYRSG